MVQALNSKRVSQPKPHNTNLAPVQQRIPTPDRLLIRQFPVGRPHILVLTLPYLSKVISKHNS